MSSNPTIKELLYRLEDRNKKEHDAIVSTLQATIKEFTIFKWKTIGIASAAATIVSSCVAIAVRILF